MCWNAGVLVIFESGYQWHIGISAHHCLKGSYAFSRGSKIGVYRIGILAQYGLICSMLNILVTGAAGFIGSHLADKLLDAGHRVIGVDNYDPFYSDAIKRANLANASSNPNWSFYEIDLRDKKLLDGIKEDVDLVIHLAAKAGVLPSVQDPEGFLANNVIGTSNLIEWTANHNCSKFIFASSSSVYGNNTKVPFSEEDSVDHPISPYAFTKKACELMTHSYHITHELDIVNLRFFTVYGPRQRPDLAIHKFTRLIRSGQAIEMYGDGSTARDYTFVDDTLQGILGAVDFIMEDSGIFETINLGNSDPVLLRDLISMIYEKLEVEPNVIEKPMQTGDVVRTYADIRKAKSMLGYNPKTKLSEGLDKFLKWYLEWEKQLVN